MVHHSQRAIMVPHFRPMVGQMQSRDSEHRPHDVITLQSELHRGHSVEISDQDATRQCGERPRREVVQQLQALYV